MVLSSQFLVAFCNKGSSRTVVVHELRYLVEEIYHIQVMKKELVHQEYSLKIP